MAATDDFFGTMMLGADPYHQPAANRLSRLQQLDQILQSSVGAPAGSQQPGGRPSTPTGGQAQMPMGAQASPFGALLSGLARQFMQRGTAATGDGRNAIIGDQPDPGGGGGGGGGGDTGGGNCPPGQSYWGPKYGCRPDSAPSPCPAGTHFDSGECVDNNTTPPGQPPPNPGPTDPNNPTPQPAPNPPPREGAAATGGGPYTDATIPGDLRNLRLNLGQWLAQNFNQYNPQYAGQLTVPGSGLFSDASSAGLQGFTNANNILGMAQDPLSSLLGFNATSDLSSLANPLSKILGGANSAFDPTGIQQLLNVSGLNAAASRNYFDAGASSAIDANKGALPFFNQGAGFLNNLSSLTQNGGAPDITQALEAIRTRGMMDIQDQTADIREKFGAMGLGASSDVAEAVARGASRGVADINSQQSQLAASILSAAKDRQLQSVVQGAGAAGGLGSAFGNLGLGQAQTYLGAGQGVLGQAGAVNSLGQLLLGTNSANAGFANAGLDRMLQGLGAGQNILNNPAQLALQSAGVNLGALGQLPGIAGAYSGAGSAYGGLLSTLMGQEYSRQGSNINSLYQDFVRSTTNPYLNTAAGYATGFPPTPNTMQTSSPIWGMLGSLGGAAISALPWAMMFSSREFKEDIQDVEMPKPITERLKQLPIKTWRYIGDPVRHIGPMAEDWKETFGVGDGKTIFIPDMLNVIMGVLKEAHA